MVRVRVMSSVSGSKKHVALVLLPKKGGEVGSVFRLNWLVYCLFRHSTISVPSVSWFPPGSLRNLIRSFLAFCQFTYTYRILGLNLLLSAIFISKSLWAFLTNIFTSLHPILNFLLSSGHCYLCLKPVLLFFAAFIFRLNHLIVLCCLFYLGRPFWMEYASQLVTNICCLIGWGSLLHSGLKKLLSVF